MNGTLYQFKPANLFSSAPKVRHVGYQSWTEDNLLVESDHNDILYYTTRWDALCPYINVSEEMLNFAPRPFVVYALPPTAPMVYQSTTSTVWSTPLQKTSGLRRVVNANSANSISNTNISLTQKSAFLAINSPLTICLKWG